MTIDTVQICALMDAAIDIAGPRVRALYRAHGVGEAVEQNVVTMLRAALNCVQRAAALAAENEAALAPLNAVAEKITERIEDHLAEAEGWRIATAMAEGEGQTLH
ncbi:hypothetical protein [Caballeronia sp. KNU42]